MLNELETTACPLCGHPVGIPLRVGRHFAPFGLRACPGCSLHYLSPRLTEQAMTLRYASDRYFAGAPEGGYADYARQEVGLRATFRRLLRELARRGRTGGALLEVGCGHGFLLDEARGHFSRRIGTEFSPAAARIANARADMVFEGGADAALGRGEQFDCIIATHVIEHVYQPQRFTRALLDGLKPGGTLVLAAPDAGSPWRKLLGRHWPSFKLPEHVLFFDRGTLARLLRDSGFPAPIEIPYPHAFPLPLVAAKLGLRLPDALHRIQVWLPATTVAMIGVKPDA